MFDDIIFEYNCEVVGLVMDLMEDSNYGVKGKTIHTVWGDARIDGNYYRIISSGEGNLHKFLHRCIWESFYGFKLPSDWVIHHVDCNPLNNQITNLFPMTASEHNKYHSLLRQGKEVTVDMLDLY